MSRCRRNRTCRGGFHPKALPDRQTNRVILLSGGALVLSAAAWSLWPAETGRPEAAVEPTKTSAKPQPGPATAKSSPAAKVARIQAAQRARVKLAIKRDPSPTPEPVVERCEEDCWGTLGMQLALGDVVSGCRESLPEGVEGTMRFEARVIAEPEVGTAIESVEVLDDLDAGEDFIECIVESALLAELSDADAPVADKFVFRYSAGPRQDPAKEFLAANVGLTEKYPELAPLLAGDSDAPPDESATTFAKVISENDDARTAFTTWVTEQGVDLSNVGTQ